MPQLVHRDARERSHVIQERFGLILLIVLGDSFLLLLGSVGSDNTMAQPLFFIASVLLVFSIWALYFPELSKAAFPETLRAGYARLGAHFLLVLSSTVAIVACTWMTKYSFPQLAASVRQEGAWTALPIFTISASILWLTLLRDRRMSGQSVLHLTCSAALLVLALFGIFANDLESYWLLLTAVGVLIAQAILSLSAFRVSHSVV
jgi:low temperature requirement protein LtrA